MGFRAFGLLFLAIMSGWNAYKAIKTGQLDPFRYSLTRAENPVRFWAGVGGFGFLCALFTSLLVELLLEVS